MKQKFELEISTGYYGFGGKRHKIPVYVCELTDCMQVRIAKKSDGFTLFECGLDCVLCPNVWTSTTRVWGRNIEDFLMSYLRLVYKGSLDDIKYIVVCDDPIYEDKENDKVDAPIANKNTKITEVNNIGE